MSALAAFLAGGFVSAALISLAGCVIARACTRERESLARDWCQQRDRVNAMTVENARLTDDLAVARAAATEANDLLARKEAVCQQLQRELSWRAARNGAHQC